MGQEPRYSADGNWWWDGTKWVPVAHTPPSLSPPPPPVVIQQVPMYAGGVAVVQPSTNGMATASLVFGIISWFLCPCFGGLLAVIFGHVARGQIRRTGEAGGGMAMAGLILGYLHLAVTAFFVIIYVFFGGLAVLLGILGSATPTPSP